MNTPFTLTSALVLLLFLTAGPMILFFFANRESKRQKKLMDKNKYPSAKKRIYSQDVEDFLSLDDFEKKIS